MCGSDENARTIGVIAFKQAPTLRRVGFQIETPADVDVRPGSGETAVRCTQSRGDGRPVGELEVAVFQASLVIDRDGVLEEMVHEAAVGEHGKISPAMPVSLQGASGFRAEVQRARAALPYVHVFAIAPNDHVQGGLLVTVRSAAPDWPAADAILTSLRILTRGGRTANDGGEASPMLPVIGSSDDRSDS